jgi:hypothetical protein
VATISFLVFKNDGIRAVACELYRGSAGPSLQRQKLMTNEALELCDGVRKLKFVIINKQVSLKTNV